MARNSTDSRMLTKRSVSVMFRFQFGRQTPSLPKDSVQSDWILKGDGEAADGGDRIWCITAGSTTSLTLLSSHSSTSLPTWVPSCPITTLPAPVATVGSIDGWKTMSLPAAASPKRPPNDCCACFRWPFCNSGTLFHSYKHFHVTAQFCIGLGCKFNWTQRDLLLE